MQKYFLENKSVLLYKFTYSAYITKLIFKPTTTRN